MNEVLILIGYSILCFLFYKVSTSWLKKTLKEEDEFLGPICILIIISWIFCSARLVLGIIEYLI